MALLHLIHARTRCCCPSWSPRTRAEWCCITPGPWARTFGRAACEAEAGGEKKKQHPVLLQSHVELLACVPRKLILSCTSSDMPNACTAVVLATWTTCPVSFKKERYFTVVKMTHDLSAQKFRSCSYNRQKKRLLPFAKETSAVCCLPSRYPVICIWKHMDTQVCILHRAAERERAVFICILYRAAMIS